MAFGDHSGAVGYLVGEENRGLEYMFIMMNAARFGVGLEGVAACERAYQRARDYARDRVQCTDIGVRGGPKVPIIKHPDVRRMLMTMRAPKPRGRWLTWWQQPTTPPPAIRTARCASAIRPSSI
jgi:alkylation response protein AidB-like acyl-CoA dehydrogenase